MEEKKGDVKVEEKLYRLESNWHCCYFTAEMLSTINAYLRQRLLEEMRAHYCEGCGYCTYGEGDQEKCKRLFLQAEVTEAERSKYEDEELKTYIRLHGRNFHVTVDYSTSQLIPLKGKPGLEMKKRGKRVWHFDAKNYPHGATFKQLEINLSE